MKIPQSVTSGGLRERAIIMRERGDESCAQHLELAAAEIDHLSNNAPTKWICQWCREAVLYRIEKREHTGVSQGGGPTIDDPNRPCCKADESCCDFACGN